MPTRSKFRNVGLARALSKMGYCSRSRALALIRSGHVRLNGTVRLDPEAPVHLDRDRISVNGHLIEARQKTYLIMNKPRGLVTTASDEKGRDTVYSIFEKSRESLPWIAPVGRLDKASEGLLLWTNDSEWGALIAAPESHLDKTYHVQINTPADESLTTCLIRGVRSDGDTLRARDVSILRSGEKNSWLQVILDEGKNRQIRRMLSACGVEVLRLIRVAIGPLELGNVAKGTYRHLSSGEKAALDEAVRKSRARSLTREQC